MAAGRILIVDDNPINLKLVRVTLAREGFQLAAATSAEDALILMAVSLPDLILLDMQLPGMDGLELTRRLKSDARTRHIAVVAVTAYAAAFDEQNAFAAGCDGFIHRPIDTRMLGAQVTALLAAVVTGSRAMPRHYPLSLHHRSRDVDAGASGKRGG